MERSFRNQAIALAALSQALHQVQGLARRGELEEGTFAPLLRSILMTEAASIEEVYGGLEKLLPGFRKLRQQLGGTASIDQEHTRYAISVMVLERKLKHRPDLLRHIGQNLERARALAEREGLMSEAVRELLAETYRETVSTLEPAILIYGERRFLQDREIARDIRTLLLAAIRAAVLWRQAGGSRPKLLLFRNQLLKETERLLQQYGAG